MRVSEGSDSKAAVDSPLAVDSQTMKKAKPAHYKIVCISLYVEDIARLDGMVAELKRRGHYKANKSQLIRAALEQVDLDRVPKSEIRRVEGGRSCYLVEIER